MKNTRTGQKTIRKLLKGAGSAILLATLFVLVFAGTLSGAFGIEENLQQNGIIESNVARAATTVNTWGDFSNNGSNTDSINSSYTKSTYSQHSSGHDYWVYYSAGTALLKTDSKLSGGIYTEWKIIFDGEIYQAIKNGAISELDFKLKRGGNDNSNNYIEIYDNSYTKIGECDTKSDKDAELSVKISATKGTNTGTSYIYIVRWCAKRSRVWPAYATIDTKMASAWVDIYRSDNTAPKCTAFDLYNYKFTFADYADDGTQTGAAGISKIEESVNGGAYSDITTSASITNNTKNATYITKVDGLHKFRLTDNVDNVSEVEYYIFKGAGTSEDDPYLLRNRTEFDWFATYMRGAESFSGYTFSGRYFKVQPDNSNSQNGQYINMLSTAYTPGGYYDTTRRGLFQGQFDGDNKEIRNLVISLDSSTARAALIGSAGNNAVIKNVYIGSGSSIKSERSDVAGIVAYATGSVQIINCVNYATISSANSSAYQNGGIIGNIAGSVTVSNCHNYGAVYGAYSTGGIVGFVQNANGKVENCVNSGTVSGSGDDIGGIAGKMTAGTISGTTTNNKAVTSSGGEHIGGIVGLAQNAQITGTITNNGAVTATSSNRVGGVVGYMLNSGTLADAKNTATVRGGAEKVGGIVGVLEGSTIDGATNSGAVSATGNDVGGVVGGVVNGATVKGSLSNEKNVSGVDNVGGIVGYNQGTIQGSHTVKGNCKISGNSSIGGIVGYNDTTGNIKFDSISNSTVTVSGDGNEDGDGYVGGVIGYNLGTLTISNATNNAKVTATANYVGGFFGYVKNSGITFENIVNQGEVSTNGNYAGGIVGGVASNTTVKNSTNKASVKGVYYVGGVIGGFTEGVVTITSCINEASIEATTKDVGGIIGYAEGAINLTISGCYNTGSITGGSSGEAGGIAGRVVTTKKVENNVVPVKISHCYNLGSVTNTSSDSTGGIVGYAYSSNSGALVIEYCYNKAKLNGKEYVGGIVGSSNTTQYLTINYCYVIIDETNTIKHNTTEKSVGAIIGGAYGGQNVTSNYTIANSWGFLALDANNGYFNDLGKVFFTNLTLTPQVHENTWTDVAWTDILSKNINGFKVDGATKEGEYASSVWGTISATSTAYDYKNVATPDRIDTSVTANSNSANVAQTDSSIAFTFYYDASFNPNASAKGVRAEVKSIAFANDISKDQRKEYNAELQVVTNPTVPQIVTTNGYSCFVVYFDDANFTQNRTDNGKTKANTYYYIADIVLGGKVVGRYSATFTITPYDFGNGKVFGTDYWFGATENVVVTNQYLSEINDEYRGVKVADLFLLNKDTSERPQALIYQGADSYTQSNFILYIKYTIIGADGVSHTVVKKCDEFEITEFVSALAENEHVREGTRIAAQGKDGSVVGEIYRYYTLLDSDFGWTSADSNAKWGTKDNPYVISTQAQLMRLSQILNGDVAWNSINSDNKNIVLAKEERAVATDKTYSGAYFVVTADIHLDGTFKPIGNADIPFKATSFASNTDGTLVTISYYYNDTDTVDTEYEYREYVGLFGNVEGTHFKDLLVWGGSYNGGTSYTGKQIIGQNFVGGLVGKMVGGIVENCTFTSNVGGASIVGNNYVGGLIGYANGTQVLYDTSDANMGTDDNLVSARVTGVDYVGGVIGQWIITSASQFNNGNANGLYFSTTANIIVTSTGSYAGAIAGALDASACADNLEIKAKLNVYPKNAPQKAQVNGVNYVGALYGSFIGNGTDKTTVKYDDTDVWAKVQFGASGRVVGGFIGYLQDATLKFNRSYVVDNKSVVFEASSGKTPSFFGGVVGVLGKGANIAGTALDANNKTFRTVTNTVNFGKDFKYGDFVGGIIGYVSSGAGRSNMGSTIFGDDLIFVGQGEIHANNYVGGIFGAIGIIDSYTIGDTLLFNTIRYGSTTAVANDNIVTFKPSSAKNVVGIYGSDNVGGLVGGVFKKALIYLENAVTDADNPTFGVSNGANVEGNTYVGGIVGYLEQESHVLNRIVNTGVIGKSSASYVGGLVGYMIGGTISNSVSASKTAPNQSTNLYLGSKYVGGLVGFMQGGSLENSLSTGFKFDGNNTSITKGGVVGDKLSPIIEGSWTIYIATYSYNEDDSNYAYRVVSNNANGKYVLIDKNAVSEVGTYGYVLAMAGVCNATSYGNYEFKQGELLIGVDYPTKSDFGQDDDQKQPQQLAFYDVSGSDSVMKTPTTKLNSDGTEVNIKGSMYEVGGVVHIGVSMADGDSYSVCNYNVKFSNIKKFFADNNADGTNVEGRKNAEEGYLAPSGAKDRYRVEVISAQYTTAKNNDNGGDIERIIANIYFNDVLIASVESVVGNYDSGKLTPGDSETTAYTISTQAEWNDFAWNIYTGQNDYKNKYIKLLTDITIEKKATHTGTNNASYNFNNTTTPNSNSSDSKNATSNLGYNIAGNIAQGADDTLSIITVADVSYTGITKVTPSFKGHFDGNGHTITIKFTEQAHRASVFPNSQDATFRNLTVAGNITSTDGRTSGSGTHSTAGYDIAGFVGKPFGRLDFYNCTNSADVTGLRNVAGILGYNAKGYITTLETCVNEGNITSLEGSFTLGGETNNNKTYSYDDEWGNKAYPYGTGGIIGGVTGNLTIQSCRNTGNVTGGHNVGGIIGYSDGTGSGSGVKTLIIDSCANSGKVLANSGNWNADQGGLDGDDSRGTRMNIFGYAGGIVGRTGEYSLLRMYASYNSGEIITYSNIAGGLVGGVGYMKQPSGQKNAVVTPGKSVIAYCYNIGSVKAGGTFPKDTENWGVGERENHGGDMAGGIAGLVGHVLITDCYNTADIYNFGIAGYQFSWQLRAGGIVGQSDPSDDTKSVNFNRCYNVGQIYSVHIRSWTGGVSESVSTSNSGKNLRYGAGISGYCDNDNGSSGRITATNCYSLAYCVNVRPAKRDQGLSAYQNYNTSSCAYWDTRKENWLYCGPFLGLGEAQIKLVKTGDLCETKDALTAVMKSNSTVEVDGNGWVELDTSNNGKNSYDNLNGAKASFNLTASTDSIDATLTNKGTSASDYPSGWIFVYGCLPQLAVFAVDTYNGLSMRSVNYGRDVYGNYQREIAGEEYSPFVIKDGIDLLGLQALVDLGYSFDGKYVEFADGTNNLEETTSKIINMPTDGTSFTSTNAYQYSEGGSNYSGGKSYHLFSFGAASEYSKWKDVNYRYTSGDKLEAKATFANQNFIAIGRNGKNNVFKGHISGAQTDGSVTEVANLRIANKGAAGLFGYVQDAEIYSVGVSGTVIAYAGGMSSSDSSVAGGIVAVSMGASVIDGCEAGSDSRSLEVYAYSITQTYNNDNVKNIATSAGGIVGLANTVKYNPSNNRYYYSEGTTATISNNKVVNATVSSAKKDIGGIVGLASGIYSGDHSSGKNNKVEIASNVVEKAKIGAISASGCSVDEVGTRTGGIIGYSDEYLSIIVRECVVGTDSATNTVTIQGENRVGGIVGETPDAVNEIIGCKVLKSATIERASNWGVVTNAGEGGTAIGGIVGLTYNASGTDPITTTFSGNIVFQGTISVGVQTNYISASNRSNDGVVRNVGGIVGDMGSGARIATGSTIEVGGTIEITADVDTNHAANRNIGGVAGRTDDVAFSGTFKVAPTITAKTAYQIGGFIGKNNGIVNILADDTDIEIGGNISASHDIGGFIGYNSASSTLLIGADQYRAVNYNDGLSIKIVMSVSDTDKKATIDTLIKGEGDNVGGIVGNSEQNGVVKIVKGTIVNVGQVAGQDNVGGIIGINNGTLSTGGSVYDTTLEIINEGKVSGNDFVGGVIGKLNVGQIAGRFINRGNVSGRDYVGGSIGYVAKEASILSTGAGKTEFINEAVAIAGQSDALVAADDAIADDSKFNVSGRYYVGGSIGLLLGRSLGNEEYKVEFRSKGTVDGDKYVGGSIGVLAGKTEYTDFISEGEMTGVKATTAVGGSVGFIGVPNPLIKDGTVTEADIVVSHTHFEANGTLTLNGTDGKPEGVGEYVWGGIGGAIGAIGNAEDNLFDNSANNRWTDNTYYASGNVTAEGFFHVGGIVGLIKADNITIENMLAYDTKVTGGKNVGGIAGATIGKNTVINSAFSISTNENGGIFTAPQGNAGGIIGLAQEDTDASTSYWVKGYTNAELAGSSVTNLKTTLGRYTLAYEVYALDGKEVTVVFTKELIGTGTTTGDEGGETGDEETAIYPTPYAYYESVGTHKATNGKTYTVNEEEITDDNGYILINEELTWQAYFDKTFGEGKIKYQQDVGAWVEEKSTWTEYSTGTKQTGWYFVYANDQQGGNNQIGTVDAVHSTATAEGYSDLWYWKRIANAYTMNERNAGYDDDTKANGPYAKTSLNSAIVRENVDGTISTVPHKGNLYATATAANFKTNANASGYYMYIASSGDTKPTSINYDGKFFIQAEGGVSQNVAVYYRSIAMGSALTYNGYVRYAPISLSNDIKYDASVSEDNNDKDIDNTDKKNLYFYNTVNKDAKTPRIPDTYYTTVYVYYFDDNCKAYVVGGIDDGAWKINARQLTFKATDVTGKKYGDEDIATTITITDIASVDINDIEFTLTIDGVNTPIKLNLKNGAKFDENQGVTFGSVNVFETSDVTLKGNDTKYVVGNFNRNTGKLTFDIAFKNAKNYELSIGMGTTAPSTYYKFKGETKKQINVEQKELKIEYVNGEKSADFDNKTHGISWKVTGFVFGENLNNIAMLSPKIYVDVDKDTNDYTTSLISNGVFASLTEINTSSNGRTSKIVVEVTQGNDGENYIKLTGAKLKGTYYLAFDYQTVADCNYKFVTANDKVSDKLVISDNSLTVVWSSKSSDVYNKTVGSIIATVTATKPIEDLAAFVEEYFAISGNVNKLGYVETSTSKKVEIRFETNSYNVGTYKATLNKSNKILEIDCNCTTPTSKTYTITQRTLAFTYQMTSSGNSFEYNSYYQGLKTVTVSNVCDGDSVQLGIGGDVTVAQSAKADGATITVVSSNTSTSGTIDVGSYSAYVTIGTNTVSKNYKLPSDCTYSWSITEKSLRISGLTAQDVTYDGQEHRPNPTLSGATSQGNGVYKFGQDTIVINYNAGSELSSQSFVNAATYTISINMSQKVVAKHAGGTDASANYDTTIDGSSGTTFTIKQRKINLAWTEKALVYQNANIGQTIATVTADDGKVFTFVSSSITNAKFKGYAGNDTITFKIGGAQANAGAGQMTASIDSVTGKNADGSDSSKDNYIIDTGKSCDYNIDKMKVSVKYSSGRIADKVYDATTTVNDLSGLSFAIGSTNASTTFRPSFNDVYTVSAVYTSSNVGDWQLRLTYRFIGGANYEQEGELNETTSVAVGRITPATITISLDRLRNGRATRTFAEDKNGNISVYYGGANGAVNGQRSNRSQTYRLGEGFTISGFPSAETSGVVRVLAKYIEVGDGRALFDGYVNYVYDDGNGYVKGVATSDYVVRYNLYKALEFSIEDATENNGKAANYNFKVIDTAGDSITGDEEAQLGTMGKPIRVYDSNDQKNENVGKQAITIEITVKTYKIKYGNTSQSYANSDGSYNKDWLPVEAVDLPSGIKVDVENGWMTDENGQPKIYKQYTVIRGRANSTELSASVSGSNGKQLNYNMTNQPVLTIGYFVETSDDTFEIGSLSSLLIASYYWWVSANSGNPEFNQVINTTVTWTKIVSDTEYESGVFTKPADAPEEVTSWDEYFEWLETEKKITVFLNETGDENERGTWGYYTTTTDTGEVKKYSSFKQIRDINGTFTQSDIEMLNGFFRVYDVTSDSYITKQWGKGGEFITNFLKVGEGNVAVAIESIFKSLENGFTGAYDGGGYVIEYFNIMSFEGAENVGMFDVLGITANVKNLHLRNFNINANKGNVGGIAGKALAGENAVENVSWHGTISMSGDGNVGGLIGVSARSIDKAIALGTINAKGGNIGGLIGSIEQGASVAISNAVSFVYIDATGNVGAITASSSGATATNAFYLASSAWKRTSDALTVSNGTYGTAKTYTQLIVGESVEGEVVAGSISGYTAVDGKKYYQGSTKGAYDMLDDFDLSENANRTSMNARQSMRLKDIIDVYMLMYSIAEVDVKVNATDDGTSKVYTISSASWLVGDKHGVDGDEIEIGNRQQVALLRELRFASFVLTSDVVATATSGGDYAYGGAFFGNVKVIDGSSYTIDFGSGKRAFEALATGSNVPYKEKV